MPPQRAQPEVTIRPMVIDDIGLVLEIDRLSFSLPWPENSYRFELLQNPASLAWVAETPLPGGARRIIGMVVVWLIVDEAHIATIAIHPDYRGQGLGRDLLLYALRASVQRGAIMAALEVRANNLAALALYHEFGFVTVGRRTAYYQDNHEDALLMSLHKMSLDYLDQVEQRHALRRGTAAAGETRDRTSSAGPGVTDVDGGN